MSKIKEIGFSDWFQDQTDEDMLTRHDVARVSSVHKDRYIVTNGEREVFAELTGAFLYNSDSAIDLPTVGDWVYVDFYDGDALAIIHGVIPRKSILKRKTAGKVVDFQLIAANIDVAFIIQSADYNFNLRRLERYLVMVNESGITPVILLSKCDLLSESEIDKLKESILTIASPLTVIAFSNFSLKNIDTINDSLIPGNTYCLLGSSGVGKTTLLNSMLGSQQFETKPLSQKNNKGRHTTTSRELIQLDGGAMIIDTPGMRELGNMSADTGLDETFSEILELFQSCKFSNCTHTQENGCAILLAIEEGSVSEQRYKNYIKMKKEIEFNEMSYTEKKRKDKSFGKLVKAAIKNKKR